MKIHFLALFLFAFLAADALAQGSGDGMSSDPSQPWPSDFFGRLRGEFSREWDSQGINLSASIFSGLTDMTLFSHDFGPVSLGVEIKREVYDNHDISDTWTVIDYFRLPFRIPLLTTGDVPLGPALTGRVDLSSAINLSSMQIRQVYPKNYSRLPTVTELRNSYLKSIEDGMGELDVIGQSDTGDESGKTFWQKFKELFAWNSDNTLGRARWTKLWRLVTNPFHIPFTKKSILKKPVGEISSYQVEGVVQLDGNVGWSLYTIPGGENDTLRAGVGFTTYLKGSFRISIFKESADSAQIKLTRNLTAGGMAYLGSSHEFIPFQGFLIFGERIGRIKESLVPFSINIHHSRAKQFDIGYRYDLNNPAALDAYVAATKGLFKRSSDLAGLEGSGVTKAYTREQTSRATSMSNRIGLSFIYDNSQRHGKNVKNAVISMDDKTHHIFSSETYSEKSWDTLWGSREFKRYSVLTLADKTDYYNEEGGMLIQLKGRIEDSSTSAKEMIRYTTEIEQLLNNQDIFPPVPLRMPHEDCDLVKDGPCLKKGKKMRYKKSSFDYSINFKRGHLEKFANYPKEKRWQLLERAFEIKEGRWSSSGKRFLYALKVSPLSLLNVPLALFNLNIKLGNKLIRAKKINKEWSKLRNVRSLNELVSTMASLFMSRNFNLETYKLWLAATHEEDFTYVLNASAPKLFGKVVRTGHSRTILERLLTRLSRLIDFDQNRPTTDVDDKAHIKSMKVEYTDKDTALLTLNLASKPSYLYLQMDKSSGWQRYRKLGHMVLFNRDYLDAGVQTIEIKRGTTGNWKELLAKYLFEDFYITLKAAIKRSIEEPWGAVSSTRFRPPKPDDDDDENQNQTGQ